MIYDLYCQGASDSAATPQLYNLGPGYGSTIYCMLPGGVQSGAAGVAAMKPITLTASDAAGDPASNFTDGAILGWGVVAAMAVAWGLKQLGRAAS
ncbi:hypothetical protein [uncultured Thiobacillus sp.]|mgnify:FL=1|jgi:hypothetical protein|uniref:hypothetical protein n=1 Tax=uncultured Thiobacillus sp. TaxID=189996 RepID=UPI0026134F52|nr:hypothetical protein [uncultured Thiobacillus sp.]